MSRRAFLETFEAKSLRLTVAALKAQADVLSFFGPAGIGEKTRAELLETLPAPYLAISESKIIEKGATGGGGGDAGGRVEAELSLLLSVFLPPLHPCLDSLPVLAAPAATANGSGAFGVARRYAVSGYTGAGESYASELSDALVATAIDHVDVGVATGTGLTGRILWATKALPDGTAGTCAFLHSVIPDNTTTPIQDTTPDAALGEDIFPERALLTSLAAWVKIAVNALQTLEETSEPTLDATLIFEDQGPGKLDTRHNQWVRAWLAKRTLVFDPTTRQSLSGGV